MITIYNSLLSKEQNVKVKGPFFFTRRGIHFHIFAAFLFRIFEPPRDKTNKMTLRPAKTQISLGIRPVWSESSLCTQWVAKDPSFLHADSEDFDQTGRMPRLIWVFDGRTCHFVGFIMRRLISYCWQYQLGYGVGVCPQKHLPPSTSSKQFQIPRL